MQENRKRPVMEDQKTKEKNRNMFTIGKKKKTGSVGREKLDLIHIVIATCATAYCHNMEYRDGIQHNQST